MVLYIKETRSHSKGKPEIPRVRTRSWIGALPVTVIDIDKSNDKQHWFLFNQSRLHRPNPTTKNKNNSLHNGLKFKFVQSSSGWQGKLRVSDPEAFKLRPLNILFGTRYFHSYGIIAFFFVRMITLYFLRFRRSCAIFFANIFRFVRIFPPAVCERQRATNHRITNVTIMVQNY